MTTNSDGQFEEKMKRLEDIVNILESSDLSLEKGLELYKEGVICSRFCRDKLAQAQHELEIWQNDESVHFDIDNMQDEQHMDGETL